MTAIPDKSAATPQVSVGSAITASAELLEVVVIVLKAYQTLRTQ